MTTESQTSSLLTSSTDLPTSSLSTSSSSIVSPTPNDTTGKTKSETHSINCASTQIKTFFLYIFLFYVVTTFQTSYPLTTTTHLPSIFISSLSDSIVSPTPTDIFGKTK